MAENDLIIIDSLFKDLRKIISTLVIKRDDYALMHETADTIKNADLYFMALNQTDTFDFYQKYEEEILRSVGIPEIFIPIYANDKYKIPIDRRNVVLNAKRQYIINNFIELNDYYRKYLGLNKIDGSDIVYVRLWMQDSYVTRNICDLTADELNTLIISGELNTLITNNPDKEYLTYLGNKKLDIFKLRRSKAFSIIYIDETLGSSFISNFKNIYEQSRTYILSTVYDKAYKIDSPYYDGFIGMVILFMAMQRFIVDFLKIAILKDFYDQEIITYIFKAYGLPYFNEIPYTYQKRILKNLNILLKYKGSKRVVIDILKLFGYEDISIFKYYLLKIRKFDNNNVPVFEYKDVDGETVEDTDNMYELQFVQIPIDTENISNNINDPSNYISYDEVITNDKYWGGDEEYEELKSKILESDFNLIETKYMSLNTIYNLTNYNFELCYFLKFLIDLKNYHMELKIPFSLIGKDISIFNAIIFLFALVSKRLGFDGNIITSLSGISTVYGFNFENDQIIIDPKTKQQINLKKSSIPYVSEIEFMNDLRSNMSILNNIMNNMNNTKIRKEYIEYKKIYDILMITDINQDLYKLDNETLASTYDEYLLYKEPALYEYLQNEDINISESLETILSSFENYLGTDDFEFIFTDIPNISSDLIKRYIYLTIDIFKSYSIDLISISSYYTFDDKFFNLIKVLDEVGYETSNSILNKDNILAIDYIKAKNNLKYKDTVDICDVIEFVRT